jgi:phosphate transport system substrate-binding protein
VCTIYLMSDQPLSPCRTKTNFTGLAPSCIIRANTYRTLTNCDLIHFCEIAQLIWFAPSDRPSVHLYAKPKPNRKQMGRCRSKENWLLINIYSTCIEEDQKNLINIKLINNFIEESCWVMFTLFLKNFKHSEFWQAVYLTLTGDYGFHKHNEFKEQEVNTMCNKHTGKEFRPLPSIKDKLIGRNGGHVLNPIDRARNKAKVWAVALAVLCLAPTVANAELKGRVTITGASTIAPLMSEIAHRFEDENPGARIDVQTGGSSRGIADARSQVADIGMVSRDLKDDEKDLTAFTIARDGIGLIINAANPVPTITRDQVLGIYQGTITNWNRIGGPDRPITVVNKAEGRSTLELFLAYFSLKPTDIKAHVIIGDNEQGIKVVAGNPGAVGYVSVGSAEYNVEVGTPIRLLPFGDVPATTANVANGTYSALRNLNLVTSKAPEGLVKAIIAYAQSPAVDDLIREQFFVPIAR